MLAYIKGKVLNADNGVVILENNGVGYEIFCSASAFVKLVNQGEGELWTYLALREDGAYLYGFENLQEKSMFLKLITVSGVGPKMGITILSGMNLNDLAFCIASSDVKSLSKIKGLGKKTAERIIVELREAMGKEPIESPVKKLEVKISADEENGVLALMSLGYTKQQSVEAVKKAVESGAIGLENIITIALKSMA